MDDTSRVPTWQGIKSLHERGLLTEDNPDIVAIFQQIKSLREADRSIRSLRRSLTLDNMPDLENPANDVEIEAPPPSELGQLLDSYLELKREKTNLERQYDHLLRGLAELQATVRRQAEEISQLKRVR